MPWVKSHNDEVLKEFPNLKDFLPYLDELNKESPRGKVLISAGYLEQMLKDILTAFLMKEKIVDELFEGGNAPLGTFSARAKLAYALGLISEPEFHDIDLIRRIRNEFAHDMKASFANDGVKSRCGQLKHKVPDDKGKVSAEGQFTSAASGLLLNLVNRAACVSDQRRTFADWKR